MLIFSKSAIIGSEKSKTNLNHSFFVPQGIKELVINYSYSPKAVENKDLAIKIIKENMEKYGAEIDDINNFLPVNNLITLSFDSPTGYIGACHRQQEKQKIIIGKNSSPGIVKTKIESGIWHLSLNVHYAGCEIKYKIEIEGVIK